MCRWLAYSGTPILIEHLLYEGRHSLIDQSLHSKLGAETTNGDGFGLGWYGEGEEAGVFRSVEPAWNDQNLRELAAHVRSPLVFAHIRASSGAPVQQTNCHPFRHGRFLWMHNGLIHDFHQIKRDLVLEVDPALFPAIGGSTDSETLFFLALTFGLEDDPPTAVARAIGLVEDVGRRHGVEHPVPGDDRDDGRRQSSGRSATRARARRARSTTAATSRSLRELYPDNPLLTSVGDESRLVVSEPLGDLPGVWNEVPEATYGVIQPGDDELHPFVPLAPVG